MRNFKWQRKKHLACNLNINQRYSTPPPTCSSPYQLPDEVLIPAISCRASECGIQRKYHLICPLLVKLCTQRVHYLSFPLLVNKNPKHRLSNRMNFSDFYMRFSIFYLTLHLNNGFTQSTYKAR